MSGIEAYFKERHTASTDTRHRIHQNPELGFEEFQTADLICKRLDELGIDYESNIAGTGIVATLQNGTSAASIGLRADMDALPITELNEFDHASKNTGKMHACGHDGHTAMLLTAAEYLAEFKPFDGTVYLIFQPAEEGPGGAAVMIEEGLFERFPMDHVFAIHNMPGYPVGDFAVRSGPFMAGIDRFEISLKGVGGHAAFPEKARDPILALPHLLSGLHGIVEKNIASEESAVLAVTIVETGTAHNVIPETARIAGSIRYFSYDTQKVIRRCMETIVQSTSEAFGCEGNLDYQIGYPPTINHTEATDLVVAALKNTFPEDKLDLDPTPMMGSEDFAFMLQKNNGCYLWLGNGPGEGGCFLHNPKYDFNDALLVHGPHFWIRLVETALPAS